uniref:Uncharacterized protein n=1 Tax=Rhizophora mucronata TaxID=61149 RepID=A0A2P2J657_RHIMU
MDLGGETLVSHHLLKPPNQFLRSFPTSQSPF